MYDYLSLHNLLFSLELIIVLFPSFPSFFDWFLMNLPQIYPKLLNTFAHISICFLFNVLSFKEIFSQSLLACSVLDWLIFGLPALILGSPRHSFPQGFIWSSLLGWIPEVINPVLSSFYFYLLPCFAIVHSQQFCEKGYVGGKFLETFHVWKGKYLVHIDIASLAGYEILVGKLPPPSVLKA